jgi:hypothetical protein
MNWIVALGAAGRARRNPWFFPGPYHPGVVTYFAGQVPDDQWRRLLGRYRLFRHGDLLLQVGDFSDVLVAADDRELAALRAEGVLTDQWNLA